LRSQAVGEWSRGFGIKAGGFKQACHGATLGVFAASQKTSRHINGGASARPATLMDRSQYSRTDVSKR
jgi:hypothetical protein